MLKFALLLTVALFGSLNAQYYYGYPPYNYGGGSTTGSQYNVQGGNVVVPAGSIIAGYAPDGSAIIYPAPSSSASSNVANVQGGTVVQDFGPGGNVNGNVGNAQGGNVVQYFPASSGNVVTPAAVPTAGNAYPPRNSNISPPNYSPGPVYFHG